MCICVVDDEEFWHDQRKADPIHTERQNKKMLSGLHDATACGFRHPCYRVQDSWLQSLNRRLGSCAKGVGTDRIGGCDAGDVNDEWVPVGLRMKTHVMAAIYCRTMKEQKKNTKTRYCVSVSSRRIFGRINKIMIPAVSNPKANLCSTKEHGTRRPAAIVVITACMCTHVRTTKC